jgi:hypothetical protein
VANIIKEDLTIDERVIVAEANLADGAIFFAFGSLPGV